MVSHNKHEVLSKGVSYKFTVTLSLNCRSVSMSILSTSLLILCSYCLRTESKLDLCRTGITFADISTKFINLIKDWFVGSY